MALAIVQTLPGGQLASAGTTVMSALNVTTGNLLVVNVRINNGATATVADTAGNVYTGLTQISPASVAGSRFFYARNIKGNASNVITVTYGANQASAVFVWEISGAHKSTPFDKEASATTAGAATTLTTSAFTTTTANEIILCAAQIGQVNITFTAGAGYALDSASTGYPVAAGARFAGTQHQIVSSIQTGVTASISWSPIGSGDSLNLATFRIDSPVVGVPNSLMLTGSGT